MYSTSISQARSSLFRNPFNSGPPQMDLSNQDLIMKAQTRCHWSIEKNRRVTNWFGRGFSFELILGKSFGLKIVIFGHSRWLIWYEAWILILVRFLWRRSVFTHMVSVSSIALYWQGLSWWGTGHTKASAGHTHTHAYLPCIHVVWSRLLPVPRQIKQYVMCFPSCSLLIGAGRGCPLQGRRAPELAANAIGEVVSEVLETRPNANWQVPPIC